MLPVFYFFKIYMNLTELPHVNRIQYSRTLSLFVYSSLEVAVLWEVCLSFLKSLVYNVVFST